MVQTSYIVLGIALVAGLLRPVLQLTARTRHDINDYLHSYETLAERAHTPQTDTTSYYALVTDFYEYGWGQSFHFAPRYEHETFRESIKRHEYTMAAKIGLVSESATQKQVLDLGSGVGGPMREIERFTGANVTGVTISPIQVARCNELQREEGLQGRCVQGDFDDLRPLFPEDAQFDAIYTIESSVHVNPRTLHFAEIARLLKPGGLWGTYEWLQMDAYDPTNDEHKNCLHVLERGNGLPPLLDLATVTAQARDVGLELVEHYDMDKMGTIRWWAPLVGSWHSNFLSTVAGRWVTNTAVWWLESLHIAESGSYDTAVMLSEGAEALVYGGETAIFTPTYFMLWRKAEASQ